MASIGDVFMRLLLEDQAFQADAKKVGAKGGETAGKSFSQQFNKSFKSGFEGVKLGAGIAAFNLLSDAAGGAVDAIFDSIDAASAMNESVSKVGVVFDQSSDSVLKWGENAARSMGLSNQAALEASSTLGNLLLSMGKTSGEAATMSKTMVELAADLASFNNVDVQDVLMAMRSGLTGEIAPLRRFGVNLTEAALKAKAMALGLSDGKKVLDASQKSAAAYALILEQTSTAQGDFARTSTGMANQQRILNAELADTSAELGEALIPAVLEFQRVVLAALDRTSVSLERLQESSRNGSQGAQAQLRALEKVAQEMGVSIEKAWELSNDAGTVAVDVIRRNMMNASDAMDRAERQINQDAGDAGAALGGVGDAAGDMGDDVDAGAEQAAESVEDMRKRIIDAAELVVDRAYGILDDRAELSATNAEIAAQRRILASETASEAEKADARDTLRELGEDQASLVLSLAEAGAAGSKSVTDALVDMRTRLRTAVGQERLAIEATIKALELLETQGGKTFLNLGRGVVLDPNTGGKRLIGRASGGPMEPDRAYVVGERGREIVVPRERSYVVPSMESPAFQSAAQWTGSLTQTIEVPVSLDGQVITRVVARNLADELNH